MTDTWEARMAARAAEREANRPPPPEPLDVYAEHADHHTHLQGSAVYCSCGQFQGITCVVIIPGVDYSAITCGECGQVGMAGPL